MEIDGTITEGPRSSIEKKYPIEMKLFEELLQNSPTKDSDGWLIPSSNESEVETDEEVLEPRQFVEVIHLEDA